MRLYHLHQSYDGDENCSRQHGIKEATNLNDAANQRYIVIK